MVAGKGGRVWSLFYLFFQFDIKLWGLEFAS